jgi:hypothetical protein
MIPPPTAAPATRESALPPPPPPPPPQRAPSRRPPPPPPHPLLSLPAGAAAEDARGAKVRGRAQVRQPALHQRRRPALAHRRARDACGQRPRRRRAQVRAQVQGVRALPPRAARLALPGQRGEPHRAHMFAPPQVRCKHPLRCRCFRHRLLHPPPLQPSAPPPAPSPTATAAAASRLLPAGTCPCSTWRPSTPPPTCSSVSRRAASPHTASTARCAASPRPPRPNAGSAGPSAHPSPTPPPTPTVRPQGLAPRRRLGRQLCHPGRPGRLRPLGLTSPSASSACPFSPCPASAAFGIGGGACPTVWESPSAGGSLVYHLGRCRDVCMSIPRERVSRVHVA